MSARNERKHGVRRAYGFTWYCTLCDAEMKRPRTGATFDDSDMSRRQRAAKRSFRYHLRVYHSDVIAKEATA